MRKDNIFAEVEERAKRMVNFPLLTEEVRQLPQLDKNAPISECIGEVSSVAEYLQVLGGIETPVYFRGEPQQFNERLSGVLRGNRACYAKKLPTEFRREVIPTLNENERLNFVSFAQHYGVYTNLLDITTSPLTALYFACESGEDGFVYVFSDDYIDLTEILDGRLNYFYDSRALFDLISSDHEAKLLFIRELKRFRSRNRTAYFKLAVKVARFLRDLLNENRYRDLITECFESSVAHMAKSKEEVAAQRKWFNFDSFKEAIRKDIPDELRFMPEEPLIFLNNDAEACAMLLSRALQCCGSIQYLHQKLNIAADFLPNLLYRPVAARSKRQQSHFFVQPFLYGSDGTLIWQRINGNLSVKIPLAAKKALINELDRLDINEKTIFSDFDHTAAYITRKVTSAPIPPEEMLYL